MGFFKRLGSLFSTPAQQNNSRDYWINVRCKRCGEEIQARVDLWNELSWPDPDSGDSAAYTSRKVLMGDGKCFQQIEVNLAFDSNRKIVRREIRGGEFLD